MITIAVKQKVPALHRDFIAMVNLYPSQAGFLPKTLCVMGDTIQASLRNLKLARYGILKLELPQIVLKNE